jgi:hypothetical protein
LEDKGKIYFVNKEALGETAVTYEVQSQFLVDLRQKLVAALNDVRRFNTSLSS